MAKIINKGKTSGVSYTINDRNLESSSSLAGSGVVESYKPILPVDIDGNVKYSLFSDTLSKNTSEDGDTKVIVASAIQILISTLNSRIGAVEGSAVDNTIFVLSNTVGEGAGSRLIKTKSTFKGDVLVTSSGNINSTTNSIRISGDVSTEWSIGSKIIITDPSNTNVLMTTVSSISFDSVDTIIILENNWVYSSLSSARVYTVDGYVNPEIYFGDIDNNLQSLSIKHSNTRSFINIFGSNSNEQVNRNLTIQGYASEKLSNLTLNTDSLTISGDTSISGDLTTSGTINGATLTSSQLVVSSEVKSGYRMLIDRTSGSAYLEVSSGDTTKAIGYVHTIDSSGYLEILANRTGGNGKMLFAGDGFTKGNLELVNFKTDSFQINGVDIGSSFEKSTDSYTSRYYDNTDAQNITEVETKINLHTANSKIFTKNNAVTWNSTNHRVDFGKSGSFKVTWSFEYMKNNITSGSYATYTKKNSVTQGYSHQDTYYIVNVNHVDHSSEFIQYVTITSGEYLEFYIDFDSTGMSGTIDFIKLRRVRVHIEEV